MKRILSCILAILMLLPTMAQAGGEKLESRTTSDKIINIALVLDSTAPEPTLNMMKQAAKSMAKKVLAKSPQSMVSVVDYYNTAGGWRSASRDYDVVAGYIDKVYNKEWHLNNWTVWDSLVDASNSVTPYASGQKPDERVMLLFSTGEIGGRRERSFIVHQMQTYHWTNNSMYSIGFHMSQSAAKAQEGEAFLRDITNKDYHKVADSQQAETAVQDVMEKIFPSDIKLTIHDPFLTSSIAVGHSYEYGLYQLVDPAETLGSPIEDAVWRSSDPSVARVESGKMGKVTALKPGYITLYASWKGVEVAYFTEIKVFDLYIDSKVRQIALTVGDSHQLEAFELPDDVNCTRLAKWSADSDVVVFTGNRGEIKANREGTTIVKATRDYGISGSGAAEDTITVVVKPKEQEMEVTPREMTLEEGESGTFEVLVDGKNVTNQCNYRVDDSSVATQSGNKITGKKAGQTTIRITYGKLTSSISVTVKSKGGGEDPGDGKKNLVIKPVKANTTVGETVKLDAYVMPGEDPVSVFCSWTSSNTKVATVSGFGRVKGVAEGVVTITATYPDIPDTATATVYVFKKPATSDKKPTSIRISPRSAQCLVGEKVGFSVAFTPKDAVTTVAWSVSDASVASIDQNGVLTAKKAGSVTVTCMSANGKSDSAQVTVTEKAATLPTSLKISPRDAKCQVDGKLSFTATFTPANAQIFHVWKVSDNSIASIDQNGQFTAKKAGTVTVTCTTANGLTDSTKVTVEKDKTTYRALILGYNKYSDGMGSLLTRDAAKINVTFMEIYLKRYTQYTKPVVKENRKLKQTKNDIKIAFKGATENDVSLVYVTGISTRKKNGSIALKTADSQYWSLNSLRAWLANIPGQIVVILDMDYSGAFITKSADTGEEYEDITDEVIAAFAEEEDGAQSKALANKKFRVLVSCSQGQTGVYRYVSSVKDYMSVFTNNLCVGMQPYGADANKNSIITLTEMYDYLAKNSANGRTVGVYPKGNADTLFKITK